MDLQAALEVTYSDSYIPSCGPRSLEFNLNTEFEHAGVATAVK